MTWVKLHRPDAERRETWVNMDRVAQMIVGEFWEMGRQTTRLFTGHIAMAANMETSASDYFSIDVVETPEAILSLASHDGETSRG